jgi:hypothetical protein
MNAPGTHLKQQFVLSHFYKVSHKTLLWFLSTRTPFMRTIKEKYGSKSKKNIYVAYFPKNTTITRIFSRKKSILSKLFLLIEIISIKCSFFSKKF